jgi:DNA-binding GntR family transcriptional regulator
MRFRDHFAAMIEAGTLAHGTKLPTERALADEFSITRVTVRQGLSRMEAEGLIFSEERKGWFVSPPRVHYDPTASISFTESVTNQGRVAGTTTLPKQEVPATQWLSTLLGCATGDPVFIINRLRSVDGRVVLVEQIHVNAERCPDLLDHALEQSMTDLLAEIFGIMRCRTDIQMRPIALPEKPANALGVGVGTPSLYITRIILDEHGKVNELDLEFWRYDVIDICISGTLKS